MVSLLRQQNPKAVFWSPGVAWNQDWLAVSGLPSAAPFGADKLEGVWGSFPRWADHQGFFGKICPGGLSGCDYAPQYLVVHVYALDIDNFKNQINAYHDRFGLDIVVSEYACYVGCPSRGCTV